MPFTFKLSQRLARMRCAILLISTAALAACEKPAASISGPTNPGARVVKLIVSPELITLLSSQSMQFAALGLTEAGSTYSMKCAIPAIDYGAAALQAWFGNGRLAGTPKDPSLDQDLFQQVRFVLAPGAAAAIGGTACTALNPTSQFKVHKSVYGQAGSAVNGWVMSAIGPCSDGSGLASEAEMWNIDGRTYAWSPVPSLLEGSVYDVIYRYHRYTAQGCGTIAVWVNGTKVWDSPCQSYLGTTNGSTQGLLFWDGATYLQSGLAALTVYTLFTQATNYPIGPATASP